VSIASRSDAALVTRWIFTTGTWSATSSNLHAAAAVAGGVAPATS
jgi:hypothetical protein